MMGPNTVEHPRPSACKLLTKPPFATMPLPSGIRAPAPADFLSGSPRMPAENGGPRMPAENGGGPGVGQARLTPLKGALPDGITPRISDLFSQALRLKRVSEHFQHVEQPGDKFGLD